MSISRDTADRAISAWNQVKEGKEPTIKWDLVMNSGEEALRLCEQEKLIHLFDEDQGHILYLDSRYNYNIVDIREYDGTLRIILDNDDRLAFKIAKICDKRESDPELNNNSESKIRIRMLKTVIPEFPFNPIASPQIRLLKEEEYDATSNKYGAVSAICSSGDPLGVKPGEFEFVSAPQWVLKQWIPNATAISALDASRKKDGGQQ